MCVIPTIMHNVCHMRRRIHVSCEEEDTCVSLHVCTSGSLVKMNRIIIKIVIECKRLCHAMQGGCSDRGP